MIEKMDGEIEHAWVGRDTDMERDLLARGWSRQSDADGIAYLTRPPSMNPAWVYKEDLRVMSELAA